MGIYGKSYVSALHFFRKLRGGCQPILVSASDGCKYVLKFPGVTGPNVLANEALGTELYGALGLPVPAWRPIAVSEQFILENPGCWIEGPFGPSQPQPGLCFGSAVASESTGSLLEILPGSSWAKVLNRSAFLFAWMVDVWAEHRDNRQAVFTRSGGDLLSAVFIDHGHMFGGPAGSQNTTLLGPRYLDPRVYRRPDPKEMDEFRTNCCSLNADALIKKAATIPDEWKTPSATRSFLACLERFSCSDVWQETLEALLAALDTPTANANSVAILDRVLRYRLQFRASRRGAVA